VTDVKQAEKDAKEALKLAEVEAKKKQKEDAAAAKFAEKEAKASAKLAGKEAKKKKAEEAAAAKLAEKEAKKKKEEAAAAAKLMEKEAKKKKDAQPAEKPEEGLSFAKKDLTLQILFDKLDTDGNGVLSREEVLAGAELLNMTDAQASTFFDELDVDGEGTVDRVEFQQAEDLMIKYHKFSAKYLALMKKLKTDELFETLDVDGGAVLTKDEVVAGARHLMMTPIQAAIFFNDLDKDKNGTLDRSEWGGIDDLIQEYDELMLEASESFDGLPWMPQPEKLKAAREKEQVDRKALADLIEKTKSRRRKMGTPPVSPRDDAEIKFFGNLSYGNMVKEEDGSAAPKDVSSKLGMSFLAEKLTINELFERLDENGDGELSREEVIAGADLLNMTEEQASAFFDDLDVDKSGAIDRKEFEQAEKLMRAYIAFSEKYKVLMKKFEADDLFDKLDTDEDGTLTREEVTAGAALLEMTEKQASKLFSQLDVDKNGALDRSEWTGLDALLVEYDELMVEASKTFDGAAMGLKLPEKVQLARDKEKKDRARLADIVERMKRKRSKPKPPGLVVFAGGATLAEMVGDDKEAEKPKKIEAGMSFLAEKLTINELFERLDENGDGELSREEVIAGASLLNMTEEQASAFFDDLDDDGSGAIDRKEFEKAEDLMRAYIAFSEKYKVLMKKFEADDLFDKLDTDGDGTLTREEVIAGAALLEMTEKQAAKLFDDLDEDGSGGIDRSEWKNFDDLIKEYEDLMIVASKTFDGMAMLQKVPEKVRLAREKEKKDRATMADIIERMKRRRRQTAEDRLGAAAQRAKDTVRERNARKNIQVLRFAVLLTVCAGRAKVKSRMCSITFATTFSGGRLFDGPTREQFMRTAAFALSVPRESVKLVNDEVVVVAAAEGSSTLTLRVACLPTLKAATDAAHATVDPECFASAMRWAKLGKCTVASCTVSHPASIGGTTVIYAPGDESAAAKQQLEEDELRRFLAVATAAQEELLRLERSREAAAREAEAAKLQAAAEELARRRAEYVAWQRTVLTFITCACVRVDNVPILTQCVCVCACMVPKVRGGREEEGGGAILQSAAELEAGAGGRGAAAAQAGRAQEAAAARAAHRAGRAGPFGPHVAGPGLCRGQPGQSDLSLQAR